MAGLRSCGVAELRSCGIEEKRMREREWTTPRKRRSGGTKYVTGGTEPWAEMRGRENAVNNDGQPFKVRNCRVEVLTQELIRSLA